MEDGKAQLRLIEKESLRNAVCRKQVEELKKNAEELSTSYSVPAMVISFDSSEKSDVWPENRTEIKDTLKKYRSAKEEGPNKMGVELESFMRSEIRKMEAELQRLKAKNILLKKETVGSIASIFAEIEERKVAIIGLSDKKQPSEAEKAEYSSTVEEVHL